MIWGTNESILLLLLSIIVAFNQLQSFSIHFSSIISNNKDYLHNRTACITTVDGGNSPEVETAKELALYSYLKVFDEISGYSDDEFPADFPSEEGIYGEILPYSLRSLFGKDSDGIERNKTFIYMHCFMFMHI